MTKLKIILFLAVYGVYQISAAQSTKDTLWETAQNAYLQEDYENAELAYKDFLTSHPHAFAAMYNLGNCYLMSDNLGKAILWYERAKQIKPNDADILLNLSIAKARMENPVVEIRQFFLLRWLRFWSGLMSVMGWGIVSLVCFWIAIACIVWRLRTHARAIRLWMAGAAFVCFVLSMTFGLQRLHDYTRQDLAVVIQHAAQVSIAPDEGSKLVARINAGEKVLIVDSLNTYYKIRLANFEQGWISEASLEKI